jgi:putative transposase
MQALLRFAMLLPLSLWASFGTRTEQAIVELSLRQQLAAYAQARSRPRLTFLDRVSWVALHQLWPRWKEVLVIVKPETVVRWPRKGFRLYWRALSRRGPRRPRAPQEVRELIRRLAFENDWGARKIQGEFSKLGFAISLATVSRYLPKRSPDPDRRQHWMTFLRNHQDAIAAMSFCVVPTVSFQLLYVWFVIDRGRRRLSYFNAIWAENATHLKGLPGESPGGLAFKVLEVEHLLAELRKIKGPSTALPWTWNGYETMAGAWQPTSMESPIRE